MRKYDSFFFVSVIILFVCVLWMPLNVHAVSSSVSVCGIPLGITQTTVDASRIPDVRGNAVYEPSSGTLTLDNFYAETTGNTPVISFSGDLRLVLRGKNELISATEGIRLAGNGNLTLVSEQNDSSLRISSGTIGICTFYEGASGTLQADGIRLEIFAVGDGVDSGGEVCISDSTLYIETEHDGIEVETGGLTIKNSAVTIRSGEDGLDIDGTETVSYPILLKDSTLEIVCSVGQFSGYGIDYDSNRLTITGCSVRVETEAGVFSPESEAPALDPVILYIHEENFVVIMTIPGADINADGQITVEDSLRLNRYFAGWPDTIVNSSADVDGDGQLTRRDAILLARYLAGWRIRKNTN